VRKKLIKNSQPFGKNFQKTLGGDFFDSHCIYWTVLNCRCNRHLRWRLYLHWCRYCVFSCFNPLVF